MSDTEAVAVTETRLIHEFHRRATTLLCEAVARPSVLAVLSGATEGRAVTLRLAVPFVDPAALLA
ncbi:hypothetical protein ACFXJ8_20245 [Nonomuraea sp. NPDC059194]|uniref:hypothetical protein n=1 Tax=Nonomuraea sp. NPDC059194 TaxID=3346764 RepID=UPI0036A0BBDA